MISIEQLAEKLNGKLWTKGDLKRIYLDEGYNTKKMSTKTFVWQDENGDFKVSCRVDCPSQPRQWEQSQEDEIKDSVYESIENILAIAELELVDFKILEEREGIMVYVSRNGEEPRWFTEEIFYEYFSKYPDDVFDVLIERKRKIEELERPERERLEAEAKAKREAEEAAKKEAKQLEAKTLKESGTIPADAARVKHSKFGLGTVVKSDTDTIEILFDNEEIGLKKFVTKFVKLEIIEQCK